MKWSATRQRHMRESRAHSHSHYYRIYYYRGITAFSCREETQFLRHLHYTVVALARETNIRRGREARSFRGAQTTDFSRSRSRDCSAKTRLERIPARGREGGGEKSPETTHGFPINRRAFPAVPGNKVIVREKRVTRRVNRTLF